jgi:hypothetical protein
MDNNDCVYRIYAESPCLNFNVNHPIHKAVHKITNCTTEIYWTDGLNPRRYLDLDNIPYKIKPGTDLCNPIYTNELDCNRLKLQPNFNIPQLNIVDVVSGGELVAGTYQFAVQYSNPGGVGYTSYYSVTNPTPIANPQITTQNLDYQVGKSIIVDVSNLDVTGYFTYFNLAVIKTINSITSVELVGTYFIEEPTRTIIYTGQNVTQIRLSIDDIFEKFPFYEIAQDLTSVRDILVWDNLTSIDRINYQQIANQITLEWETWRIPANENYADEINATNLRGYLRDEVYAFEIVFLLDNGKQTDGFHIPGRQINSTDAALVPTTNNDFIGEPDFTIAGVGYSPTWKIYNTAEVTGLSPEYNPDPSYKGPYQYGQFAYWESVEEYPCNTDVWGDLAGQKIRHHKMPDVNVSPIFQTPAYSLGPGFSPVIQNDAVYPLGVRINNAQIYQLIQSSNLTQEQKDSIVGFKIVRGDRSTNRSIVAKGILRNVGKYKREENDYYYPNYPYNDISQDPFLLNKSNAYIANADLTTSVAGICRSFTAIAYLANTTVEYLDCYTNNIATKTLENIGDTFTFCALYLPRISFGKGCLSGNTYKTYKLSISTAGSATFKIIRPDGYGCPGITSPPAGYASFCDFCNANPTDGCCTNSTIVNGTFKEINIIVNGAGGTNITISSLIYPIFVSASLAGSGTYKIEEVSEVGYPICDPENLKGFDTDASKYRMVFNSPETSFGQPFLGDTLKIENVIFGAGRSHFVKVRDHAKYKLLTKEAQEDALKSSTDIANITGTSDVSALFAAYQAYLTIYINGITRKNYTYSFNSIASYDYHAKVDNNLGIKQRKLDLKQYLIPGVQSVGDDNNINNYQRESSVYLKTDKNRPPLPFAQDTTEIAPLGVSLFQDNSRFVASDARSSCNDPGKQVPVQVISYYASLKNLSVAQWGQIYTYTTIDTGYQRILSNSTTAQFDTIFGGDTFISRFAFKTKLPFFIDNRVNAPDDSDIFYDEIGNVAYPEYWYSARSVLNDVSVATNPTPTILRNFISFKAHNFDCPNSQTSTDTSFINPGRTYYDGKMYLFAYGIPNFYCESSYNVDLRQAFNIREGDFWPHVSTDIPDDWVQESYVTIAQDNTYFYNPSFSKQNRENFFTHLPPDWRQQLCYTNYPFRAIYSDTQEQNADVRVNNWLIYRPINQFDFPQNYGKLTSLDGIQNKAVLARFENKSLLYNTMLTVDTSNPQAAYLGNDTLFKSAPPIDFAETDLGYVGSQNKMLLKIPQGQITVDAKRGQIFLVAGNQATDLSGYGSGMNRFFTDHLAFEILRYFPNVNTDNHFNTIGLHGVYDSKFDRIIITKLDYIPLSKDIKYDAEKQEFYIEKQFNTQPVEIVRQTVYLTDEQYFCNKSWTVSFNFNTKSWISFHSYIPNWYIAENNFFYSGLNDCCDSFDFQAFVGIPVEDTTTTTTSSSSTSSTSSTTTTTTTRYAGCDLEGIGEIVIPDCTLEGDAVQEPDCTEYALSTMMDELYYTYTPCGETTPVTDSIGALSVPSATICAVTGSLTYDDGITVVNNGECFQQVLTLSWDNIANVPVASASSVSDWNTYFDLPTNGSSFTSVDVIGNDVLLKGGINITLIDFLFNGDTSLVGVDDTGCIVSALNGCFVNCSNLISVNLQAITTVGTFTFGSCSSLTTVILPSLLGFGNTTFVNCNVLVNMTLSSLGAIGGMGGTIFNDFAFYVTASVINLTIPIGLMTCNAGNPDGDIQWLQANNVTVNITTV